MNHKSKSIRRKNKVKRMYSTPKQQTGLKVKTKGVIKRMSSSSSTQLKATVVKGTYAQEVINDLLREPSPSAIERNRRASELVRKLRK